ncbi:MAG: trigger factor [Phycisphaerales bacterium]|nr:trigger factor [Phycisphaerales bacterium]
MPDENPTVSDEQQPAGTAVADAAVDEDLNEEESLQKKLKEVMTVDIQDIGPLRKQVTITVPRDAIDERLNEQFDELRQDAQVPGFRKGRAPMKLIQKRFGSEVGDQVGTSLIGNSYMAAIDKESLDVIGDPLVRIKVTEKRSDGDTKKDVEVEKLVTVDEALKHLELPEDGDLIYTCEVEVKPVFELPELEKIPVDKYKLKIEDSDVDAEIKRRLALRGSFQTVEDGKVEADDIVAGPSRVIVGGDTIRSEENAELAARDQNYDGLPLAGFGKAATGKKIGDVVSVEVTVPDDYTDVAARGQKATFELTINQVRRLEVPKLDKDFLASLGFDSEDEFKDLIRDQMEQMLEVEVKRSMFGQIEQYLLDSTDIEVPEGISQRHTERIVARQMMDLYSRGVAEAEISKHVDELRTSAKEQAVTEIRRVFIMEKIAEAEEVNVTEEEINAAIAEIAHRRNLRFDRVRDEIVGTNHLMTLYARIRDEKVLAKLLAGAEVTEKDPPAKGDTAAAEKKKPAAKKPAAKKSETSEKKATAESKEKKAPKKTTSKKPTDKKK